MHLVAGCWHGVRQRFGLVCCCHNAVPHTSCGCTSSCHLPKPWLPLLLDSCRYVDYNECASFTAAESLQRLTTAKPLQQHTLLELITASHTHMQTLRLHSHYTHYTAAGRRLQFNRSPALHSCVEQTTLLELMLASHTYIQTLTALPLCTLHSCWQAVAVQQEPRASQLHRTNKPHPSAATSRCPAMRHVGYKRCARFPLLTACGAPQQEILCNSIPCWSSAVLPASRTHIQTLQPHPK
jgi:hypothetical protein